LCITFWCLYFAQRSATNLAYVTSRHSRRLCEVVRVARDDGVELTFDNMLNDRRLYAYMAGMWWIESKKMMKQIKSEYFFLNRNALLPSGVILKLTCSPIDSTLTFILLLSILCTYSILIISIRRILLSKSVMMMMMILVMHWFHNLTHSNTELRVYLTEWTRTASKHTQSWNEVLHIYLLHISILLITPILLLTNVL